MQATTGLLVTGAAMSRQSLRAQTPSAPDDAPRPVDGSPNLAPFSIWAPVFVDSIDAEPASITDFNGVVGLAYVSGTVRRKNTQTRQVDVLPFIDADMRFMKGVYRAMDGRLRRGTFGFI